jgi:hypothetical protein
MYLGNKLRKYQEENNWDDVGSGALFVKHGMAKNFGLKNAIIKLMPDRVIFTGEHPKEMISLVNEKETVEVKENLEKPVRTILIEGDDNYPIGDSTNLDGIDRFRHECLRVIDESMSPVTFSMKLSASISENGFEDMTGKEFARHCGIPNNWSLLKALQTHLSDSICVDGKGNTAIITPTITGTLDSDIVDKFHQLVVAAFTEKSNEGQTLAFPELLEIQRVMKKDYRLTWKEFYDHFDITGKGAMNTKTKNLLNVSGIPHTLSRDSEEGIDYAHYSDITKG